MTRKPCPGCGEVNPYRKPDKICDACHNRLLLADKLQAEMEKVEHGETLAYLGERSYWNQRIRFDDSDNSLRSLLHQLLMLTKRHQVERSPYAPTGILGKIDQAGSVGIIIRKDIAETITALRNQIDASLNDAYRDGFHDGHKLLMRLAEGNISVNEFEDKIAKNS